MKKILKVIYANFPFKRQILILLRMLGTPSFYKHLYFKGNFKVKIDKEHSFKIIHHETHFENELFWKGIQGCWEAKTLALWAEYSKSADTILDIGANTGVFSVVSKSVSSKAIIHAFEPLDTG